MLIGRHAWRFRTTGFGDIEKDASPHTRHYAYDDGRIRRANTLATHTERRELVAFVDQPRNPASIRRAYLNDDISQPGSEYLTAEILGLLASARR
jgi:hypothetical protein